MVQTVLVNLPVFLASKFPSYIRAIVPEIKYMSFENVLHRPEWGVLFLYYPRCNKIVSSSTIVI